MKKSLAFKCGAILMMATLGTTTVTTIAHASDVDNKQEIVQVKKDKLAVGRVNPDSRITGMIETTPHFPVLFVDNTSVDADTEFEYTTQFEMPELVTEHKDKKVELTFSFDNLEVNKNKNLSQVELVRVTKDEDGNRVENIEKVETHVEAGQISAKFKVTEDLEAIRLSTEFDNFKRDVVNTPLDSKESKVVKAEIKEGKDIILNQAINIIDVVSGADAEIIKETTEAYKGEEGHIKLQNEMNENFIEVKDDDNDTGNNDTGNNDTGNNDNGNNDTGNNDNGNNDTGNNDNGNNDTGNNDNGNNDTGNNDNGNNDTGNNNNGNNNNGNNNNGNNNGSTSKPKDEASDSKKGDEAGRNAGLKAAYNGDKREIPADAFKDNKSKEYEEAYKKGFYDEYDKAQKEMLDAFIDGYNDGFEAGKNKKDDARPSEKYKDNKVLQLAYETGYETGHKDGLDGKESRELYFRNNPEKALNLVYGKEEDNRKDGKDADAGLTDAEMNNESDPQTGVETHDNAGVLALALAGVASVLGGSAVYIKRKR